MSVALRGQGGTRLDLSGSAWTFYLRLAEVYGWQPLGTQPPDGIEAADWQGRYDSNDGQLVIAADSAALAEALERALGDQGRQLKEQEVNRKITEDVAAMAKAEYGIDLPPDPDDEHVATAKDYRALVAFFRQGAFRIE